ncbi:MAG: DUF2283 domain-containing protein [Candidatus Aenigmarchaeota archaeon]|nr:DUF2283 domain-containing protein [Candidatus Aenigmarchaeota archaeon]
MEKIIVVFNKEGDTVDVWFDEPKKEFLCEETGQEIILKKDKKGKIIGFEKLNVSISKSGELPFKVMVE